MKQVFEKFAAFEVDARVLTGSQNEKTCLEETEPLIESVAIVQFGFSRCGLVVPGLEELYRDLTC